MNKRVVITGLGIVAPNAIGVTNFLTALKNGKSGIKHITELKDYKFSCQVGGIPEFNNEDYLETLSKYELLNADTSIRYSVIASLEAWKDANLLIPELDSKSLDTNSGAIIGTCYGGTEYFTRKIYPYVKEGKTKRLGSQTIEHWMPSGSAAAIGKIFALGNQTTANSSACSTSTEAICMAYDKIKKGDAKIMIAGGTDPYSPFAWAGFDSMRLLARGFNDFPEKASRPLSNTATGFVPAAGAGVLIIEDYENAIKRNANIYAEIIGDNINSGGNRNGGTMTFPNSYSVINGIKNSLKSAKISPSQIDLICGHLTGTIADKTEIINWKKALSLNQSFPYINSLKSMTGHMIGAAGAAETIAAVLQLKNNFIHQNINCKDLHPDISEIWDTKKIPKKTIENLNLKYVIKASFGFGDVNSCIILKSISQ